MGSSIPKRALACQRHAPTGKVVSSRGSNRKGQESGWRQEARRRKDRERKRKEKRRKKGSPHGGCARPGHCKGVAISGMMKAPTSVHQQRKDAINANNADKGARMPVTNRMALLSRRHVVEERLSPCDAMCRMRDELPGQRIPCLSTWHRHTGAGDVGVRHGEAPCRPKRRPGGPKPHPAMTVPGRLTLGDRPAGASNRSRFGHYGMDTVVSSTRGTGGLLVLVDRKSRRYVIELLAHVTQDEVVSALKRMLARGAIGNVRSITTDNGCEFLDPDRTGAVVGCGVYYTRAYASWEKGSVENCNRLVRRWYPKGTDFGKCTRADMRRLEHVINSIHRKLLGGKTAYEYDTAYARAA